MAGESVTTRLITTEIEHLDFDAELPCEERPCVKSPKPATLLLSAHCHFCVITNRELICEDCWKWLLSFEGFYCGFCGNDLGGPSDCLKVVPLGGKS